MANLFWKKGKNTINLVSKPFTSEDEFERIISDTKELFEDLTILKRQVNQGASTGRPDIIAIDNDGRICIIEMKNKPVDEKIFSQIISYAIWAKSNPDSLKTLWYELEDKPDVEMDWDKYEVKIMVIAPEIDPNTLRFLSSINDQVELIEIKRWAYKNETFLLVNYLEQKEEKKIKTVRGLGKYDKEFYEKYHNKESVANYFRYINDFEKLLKSRKWQFEKKFNQNYCGFKYGFQNVFMVRWISSRTFAFRVRMDEKTFKRLAPKGTEISYLYGQGLVKIIPGKTKINQFLPLIKAAIQNKTAE